jgi:hypothetical protein
MRIKELMEESRINALKQVREERKTKGDKKFFEDIQKEFDSVILNFSETAQEAFNMIQTTGQKIINSLESGALTKTEILVLGKLELSTSNLTKAELQELHMYKGALMWIDNIIMQLRRVKMGFKAVKANTENI